MLNPHIKQIIEALAQEAAKDHFDQVAKQAQVDHNQKPANHELMKEVANAR